MNWPVNPAQRAALLETIREAYMEVFPTPTIEERLSVLGHNALVALTCSPSRGVDETIDMTASLAAKGYRIVPHIAAKTVRDPAHLRNIMARLNDLPVDSIFVPGGDASEPVGDYATAFELLQAIAEFDHRFTEIGVAAHPEGHPEVPDDVLLAELEKKQAYATYLVTQMCFDMPLLCRWLSRIRARGITLPAWVGLPGVADRAALLTTSLRIGVGDSLRFLRRKPGVVMKLMGPGSYTPDALLCDLAPYLVDQALGIAGFHIFCFNQVGSTEQWRVDALAGLQAGTQQEAAS